jgi:hypothetical protein
MTTERVKYFLNCKKSWNKKLSKNSLIIHFNLNNFFEHGPLLRSEASISNALDHIRMTTGTREISITWHCSVKFFKVGSERNLREKSLTKL